MTIPGTKTYLLMNMRTEDLVGREVRYSLAKAMADHGVSVRDLARALEVTQKRVREVMGMATMPGLLAQDYATAVATTGDYR